MKLNLGENIRKYRRNADLTQAQLAEKLGVSDQAVSRWEIGMTYPDIELLPVLAGLFGCTLDELVGDVKSDKIERYHEAYAALCGKHYDPVKVCELLRLAFAEFPNEFSFGRDLCYHLAYHCDYRDEKVTDELRRVAIDILNRCTDDAAIRANVIESLSRAETDERLDDFLERYGLSSDVSRTVLLRERYLARGERDAVHIVADMDNIEAIGHLFYADFDPTARLPQQDPAASLPILRAKLDFLNAVAGIDEDVRRLRPIYADGVPDAWSDTRILCGLRISCRLSAMGKVDEALDTLEETMDLYEKFYRDVKVGTVLSFLHRSDQTNATDIVVYDIYNDYGWRQVLARSSDESGAALKAVHLPSIDTSRYAGEYYKCLTDRSGWEWFDPIREHPRFLACIERMKKAGKFE